MRPRAARFVVSSLSVPRSTPFARISMHRLAYQSRFDRVRAGPGSGQRAGGVLAEETDEFGAGVRPARVGIGAVRGATGPGMPAVVDGPALRQGRARGV